MKMEENVKLVWVSLKRVRGKRKLSLFSAATQYAASVRNRPTWYVYVLKTAFFSPLLRISSGFFLLLFRPFLRSSLGGIEGGATT